MDTSEIRVGQLGINYVVDGSDSASIGLFELTVPPGSNVPPPHSHSNNEECVYVLAGTLRYTVGAETRDLILGQSMSTPKGVVHAFSNPFTETARALIVQSPPSSTGKRQNFRNEPMKSMTWTQVSRFRVMARMLAFVPY